METFMSTTVDPAVAARAAAPAPTTATVRIEPPRGLLELRLREVWMYRELLYFFVWRDLKLRYKQTAVGVAWVLLQPLMSMGVFTLFFGKLAKNKVKTPMLIDRKSTRLNSSHIPLS